MRVTGLDHLVLTVRDISRSLDFYVGVLGMEEVTFGEGRTAVRFGAQKINLHPLDGGLHPVAANPAPGSSDLCFLTDTPVGDLVGELAAAGVSLVEGPVRRTGARGPLLSIYLRDPDGNLIEISNPRD